MTGGIKNIFYTVALAYFVLYLALHVFSEVLLLGGTTSLMHFMASALFQYAAVPGAVLCLAALGAPWWRTLAGAGVLLCGAAMSALYMLGACVSPQSALAICRPETALVSVLSPFSVAVTALLTLSTAALVVAFFYRKEYRALGGGASGAAAWIAALALVFWVVPVAAYNYGAYVAHVADIEARYGLSAE